MADKKYTEYEKLVQDIYQTLHKAEGINTIKVNHDQEIEGKSGCKHQIDVYWEFEMVGQMHRVAIECKNYANNVEVGKLRDFFGVLYDIGNVNGIFVTKAGYDSGAIKFANYYNISLQEARVPDEDDWKGRLKDIHLDITAHLIRVTGYRAGLDQQWLLENEKVKSGNQRISSSLSGLNNEINIYSSDGTKITDFLEIEKAIPRDREEEELRHRVTFDDGYLDTSEMGRVKVNFVEFTYDVVFANTNIIIGGEKIAKAILKDVKTGKIKFFDKDGNVRQDD